ncbi:2Fe-2S iron-sulfur cluster-binding protein [Aeromicrobium piscarium]|uniref:2Fe-2S iron-sulfur cluster binding domain-containing protein n=1 Tax=Aeromicrobium piscarium TaxID=2590901 RepID=A0A554RMP3_9ACTN|nr:2Fe-2S iron-sulfur cluster-binding protein [Aeromicrobium piscarium]TSD55284.1 2Fe-2S iron-sulfur cluster binding domain-containing protein [Aeromicrobium piscarium]
MTKVTYTDAQGQQHVLDVSAGTSIMAAAVTHGIDGIVGECGGNLMCATCHVYVDPRDADRLPEMSDDEEAMLEDAVAEHRPTSRLSCQLVMSDDLEEIHVEMPSEQL